MQKTVKNAEHITVIPNNGKTPTLSNVNLKLNVDTNLKADEGFFKTALAIGSTIVMTLVIFALSDLKVEASNDRFYLGR